jgi:hypothetical protein
VYCELTLTVSSTSASTVTVRFFPGTGGSGETAIDLIWLLCQLVLTISLRWTYTTSVGNPINVSFGLIPMDILTTVYIAPAVHRVDFSMLASLGIVG